MKPWKIKWIYRATFVRKLYREDVLDINKIESWHLRFFVSIFVFSLQKQKFHLKDLIDVETCIVLSLIQLGCGNTLVENHLHWDSIVYKFYYSDRILWCRERTFATYNNFQIDVIKYCTNWYNFENLDGAIYSSHIPILTPHNVSTFYYCKKEFYSILIKEILDSKCIFMDLIIDGMIAFMIGRYSNVAK